MACSGGERSGRWGWARRPRSGWAGLGACIAALLLTLPSASPAHAAGKKKAEASGGPRNEAANDSKARPEATPGSAATDEMSGFLVKPAQKALDERKYPLAVSLWRGVVAMRGDADEANWKLAEAWTLAGQFKAASRALAYYAAAVKDPLKQQRAQEEIASLDKREKGFSSGRFTPTPALNEAKEAFKRGRAAFKAKKYDAASLYFKAGIVMAPDLAGNYRELGESLDKLGRSGEANEFFMRYLRIRPFGKNADNVRTRLSKAKLVGNLTIQSVLPCDEVWIEGQRVPTKLPVKAHPVAPGSYRLLCYSDTYHHAQYEDVEVKVGEQVTASFNWAILDNKLDPWGRVVIENPGDKTQMMDVGLWPEVGVPVPADRRALRIVMTAGDGSKKKEELVKLAPGQRYVLKW
jgi:tetratricopeptide (TPR) repeat protein